MAQPQRTLELTLISAKGIKDVSIFSKMEVYAVASIDGGHRTHQRTSTDRDGGRDPTWNATLRFPLPPSFDNGVLHVVLRADRALGDRDVGEVHIPIKDLLANSSNSQQFVSYQVRRPNSGKSKGVLNISYKIMDSSANAAATPMATTTNNKVNDVSSPYPPPSYNQINMAYPPPAATKINEAYPPPANKVNDVSSPYPPPSYNQINMAYPSPDGSKVNEAYPPPANKPYQPPAATKVNEAYPPPANKTEKTSKHDEPVTAYPAPPVGYPAASSSTPYQAPPPSGYPGYPPPQQYGYGYGAPPPTQYGYGYPPPAGYGYGAAPPQQPPKKNKFGMGLGAGLLGGALGGLLIGDMVSDASAYDYGYDAGFDDGGGFDF